MDGSAPWYIGGGGGVKGEGRKDGWQCSLVHRGRGWCERRGEERWMAVLLGT